MGQSSLSYSEILMKKCAVLVAASICTALCAEYPTPSIREEQKVMVNGVSETWQLQWIGKPKPVCGIEDVPVTFTCPCMGFAYGEGGDLVLRRLQNTVEVDRLSITSLFGEEFSGVGKIAIIQRWREKAGADIEASEKDSFAGIVAKRNVVQVMNFADYVHDGHRTGFYLQTTTLPCGKNLGVVIGVTSRNPRLHSISSVANPGLRLTLRKQHWEALSRTSGAIDVIDWECGDHFADTETRLSLRMTPDGVQGMRREYTCPPNPRKLLHEERF